MNSKEKKAAALEAVKYVKDNTIVGIGTGSTVKPFIEALNQRVEKENLTLSAVPTSTASRNALHKSINILPLDLNEVIDLTIDGADRASNTFDLIKGGGGALLREKFVALNSKYNITIVDESKLSSPLYGFPLPVEIVPFGYLSTLRRLKENNFPGTLRKEGEKIYETDGGNFIYDIDLHQPIDDPALFHTQLKSLHGVIETGLFLQTSDVIIIGKNDLSVDVWKKGKGL